MIECRKISVLVLETIITLKINSIITIMNAPINIPLLLPLPPKINAAHTKKVDLTGLKIWPNGSI